jgi:beta-glucosidase
VFTVNPGDLEIYKESEGKKVIEPGRYEIYAGGNCLDERMTIEVEL